MQNVQKDFLNYLEFDILLQNFFRQYSVNDLIKFSSMEPAIVEHIIKKQDNLNLFDVFQLIWNIELMMQKDALARIMNLREYLKEWSRLSRTITDLDEGILDDKDIEQIELMHQFLDKEIEHKINLIQNINRKP